MYDTDALTPRATIPWRLDRLPLTWTLWRLGLVTQAGWAVVVATDAIAARIYPFIWAPRHAFDTAAFSVLLLVSTGVGIVAGEYFFVRSVLVTALNLDVGRWMWWPSKLAHTADPAPQELGQERASALTGA
jgi:hypothetical protein